MDVVTNTWDIPGGFQSHWFRLLKERVKRSSISIMMRKKKEEKKIEETGHRSS